VNAVEAGRAIERAPCVAPRRGGAQHGSGRTPQDPTASFAGRGEGATRAPATSADHHADHVEHRIDPPGTLSPTKSITAIAAIASITAGSRACL
jgi:hypothetical protein